MIMKANKQIGFIYKNNESIDKIIKDGDVVFESGFLRERTSTTLPINFGGVGKDLKDYRVYGNTYQNSTSGKNLRYISGETRNGVSLTYDKKTGKISVRGTSTITEGIILSYGGGVNIPAGTYTLSVSEALPVLINSIVSLGNTNAAFRLPAGDTSITVNVPSDGVLAGLYFQVTNGTTYNFDFYLQLEEGSTATEFEPYTGGQPSPNPDYPQEIISCGDRTKNLWNSFNKEQTDNYKVSKDGTIQLINSSNGPNGYTNIGRTLKQMCPNLNVGDTVYLYIESTWYRKEIYSSSLGATVAWTNGTSRTLTEQMLNENLILYGGYQTTSTIKIMITKNQYYDTYEPYGYKIPVNVRSENLFDIDTISNIGGGTNNNGIITSTTRSTSGTINLNFKFSDILVKAGETLYFSADIKLNNDSIGTFSTINDNVHAGATKIIYPTLNNKYQRYQTSYTYSNDETVKSMLIQIGNLLGNFEVSNIMISKNNNIIYQSYYNQTTNIYLDEPLRKIDGYSDYIDFINGKVVRQLGEVILDENSALSVIEIITSNNKFIWRYTTALDIIGSGARSNILSNNYIGDTTVYSANNKIGAYVNSNGITNFATLLSTVGATTNSTITQVLNLLKTWLSLHHTELIYPLETPTEETITLPNIPTVDGNNTLNIEAEITPSQVYIKYKSNE